MGLFRRAYACIIRTRRNAAGGSRAEGQRTQLLLGMPRHRVSQPCGPESSVSRPQMKLARAGTTSRVRGPELKEPVTERSPSRGKRGNPSCLKSSSYIPLSGHCPPIGRTTHHETSLGPLNKG